MSHAFCRFSGSGHFRQSNRGLIHRQRKCSHGIDSVPVVSERNKQLPARNMGGQLHGPMEFLPKLRKCLGRQGIESCKLWHAQGLPERMR